MNFSEIMFYAEANGLLPTREGKINAVINDIKKYPYSEINESLFEKILNYHGLKYETLSDREIRYINASIS